MLCDDDIVVTTMSEELIREYNSEKCCNEKINIYKYNNPKKLLERYTKDDNNLLFLDIEMKQLTGIEVAIKIREFDIKSYIIFLTGYDQHMKDGYKLHVFDYIVKPITKEKMWKALDDYFKHKKEYKEKEKHYFKYKNSNDEYMIDTDEILYFEKYKNQVTVYLKNCAIDIYATLLEALDQLPKNFYMCHRSFIVNIDKIIKKDKDKCILENGKEVLIGRTKRLEFTKFYTSYFNPFNK